MQWSGMALAVVVVWMGGSTVLAQEATESASPCRDDLARLCPDASARPAVRSCLREHADEVSQACRDRIQAARRRPPEGRRPGAERRPRARACQEDVKRLCSDVERGGGAVIACLRERESDLSQACREALPAPRSAD